jgi:magnesium transporter
MTGSSLLFDKSEARDVDFEDVAGKLRSNDLLWIDLDSREGGDVERAASALGLAAKTGERLLQEASAPSLETLPTYVHATVLAAKPDRDRLIQVDCVVSERWLLTVRTDEVEVITDFRERVTGEGEFGGLDAPTFLADLLEWVLGSYVTAFEAIEDDLEDTDVAAVRAPDDEIEGWVDQLVRLRRQSGRLRRALGAHRQLFVSLAHPEFDAVSSERSARRFTALVDQLDRGLDLASTTRESVLGSFELLVARAGHRTNQIMKILTLVSVLLLPATALAGIMGMNFKVGFFQDSTLFWVTVAVMVAVATGTLGVARLKHWI